MQITDRQHARSFGQLRTNLGPYLRPAVIRSAQERKDVGLHVLVLGTQVGLDDVSVVAEPVFKLARGFDDVHGEGHDSEGRSGSQTRLPAFGFGLRPRLSQGLGHAKGERIFTGTSRRISIRDLPY